MPGPYDVTFDRPADPVISTAAFARQVRAKRLDRFDRVLVVCDAHYERRVRAAFAGPDVEVVAPLDGVDDMLRFLDRAACRL